MFAILTLKLGIAPDYVLDRMQMYEVRALMEYQHYKSQEEWEQTRLLAYIQAQCNTKKKLKLADIIKFPWENENGNGKHKATPEVMTDKELDRLKGKAQWMIDNGMI